jgi:hypothetical protein
MNKEEIISKAEEDEWIEITQFMKLAVIQEREKCAGLRKEVVLQGKHSTDYEEGFWDALQKYEDLIRARGQA